MNPVIAEEPKQYSQPEKLYGISRTFLGGFSLEKNGLLRK